MSVPEQFFGTFKHERYENYDEYLSAYGVIKMLRKMLAKANPTKIIMADKGDGKYSMTCETGIATVESEFKLNTPYQVVEGMGQGPGISHERQKVVKVTFELKDNGSLLQRRVHVTEPNVPEELMEYTREGDYLVLTVSCVDGKDIHYKQFFKKVDH